VATTEKLGGQSQFALRDLLLIVLACAIWILILPRLAAPETFDDQFPAAFRYPLWSCVTAIVVVVLSGVLSLILTSSPKIGADSRSGWLMIALIMGPFLACAVILLSMSGLRVQTIAQNTRGWMRALAMSQEAYFCDHREYSPSLEGLGPYLPPTGRPWTQVENLPGQAGIRPTGLYVFRVLKAQGPNAPGGRKSYVTVGADGKERMTEGFAIIAIPVDGEKGIVFLLGRNKQSSRLLGKALGPDAAQSASQIIEFDPDESWIEVRR
jgi:hypothetical protein